MTDAFQVKYEAHQQRKAAVLKQLMEERHSERVFDQRPVGDEAMELILRAGELAPSSCDRKGVRVQVITDRDSKALLNGILVGGVGWIYRAPVVLLFHADPVAYKAGQEIEWNSYLDTGCMMGQMQLAAEAAGVKTCIVNPQVRPHNQQHFTNTFGPGLFTGALVIGHPVKSDETNNGLPPLWVLETS